jgi:YHS domain-containing protein
MRLSRPLILAIVPLALAACRDDQATRPGLSAYNLDSKGLALDGYSPVSYFDSGKAERGESAHSLTVRGITYFFTSAAQETAFAKDPERYEPQCGGWCAYGMAVGIRWKSDPENFEVIDGKLFLFSRTKDADARRLWEHEEDQAALVDRAERYWRSLRTD